MLVVAVGLGRILAHRIGDEGELPLHLGEQPPVGLPLIDLRRVVGGLAEHREVVRTPRLGLHQLAHQDVLVMAPGEPEIGTVERIVLVPGDEDVPRAVLEPVEVEVVHPVVAHEPVVLRHEVLERHVPHERGNVEAWLQHGRKSRSRRLVGQPHQFLDRPPLLGVALVLACLGVESFRVGAEVGAHVVESPRCALDVVVLEQVPVVLDVALDFTEDAGQEVLVHRLDDRVEADQLVVHVQPRERLARRRHAHPGEQPHRHRFLDARRVLREVVEDDRLEAEEGLVRRVAVEIDAQPGLGGAS